MSAEDDYQSIPISKDLVEQLDNEAFAKKFRYLRFMCQETLDHLACVKSKVGDVPGFWASTLLKNNTLQGNITSKSDKDALGYLTHIELVQDPKDPRPFSLKFHFKENPYFSDSVLEKTYELPKNAEAAPADGSINDSMKDFDPQELVTKPVKISWKSDDKNLCKKQPRANIDLNAADDEAGFDGDFGSFFWYFADADDTFDTGLLLLQEILPDAVEYFLGRGDDSGDTEFMSGDEDELSDDEEEGDDDEGSIDLEDDEQPNKKKPKRA